MVFKDSRLKIERAEKHIADIKSRVRALHESQTSSIEMHVAAGGETLKYEFDDTSALTDIALMLGDAIHNLNCALDYAWLQTVERLVPSAVNDRAKFPVYKTINELEGSLKKANVQTASPALFHFMMSTIKPCYGGDSAIWPVHKLDIRDKHRLLIPILTSAHIAGLDVEDETGESFKGFAGTPELQMPPYFLDFKPGLHIKNKGRLTAQIIVEYGETGDIASVPETISDYTHYISRVIEVFERFLEGQISV